MKNLFFLLNLMCLGLGSVGILTTEAKIINTRETENCIDFPAGVKFSGITPNGLIVSWNNCGPDYQYQVGYREKGTQTWKTSAIILAPNTLCAVTQLKSFTDYEIKVRAKCGSKPDFPDWSGTVLGVRTAAAPSSLCSSPKPKAPDKVNISSITQTAAILKWENVPDAAGSVIIYGLAKESPSKWKEVFLCRGINSYELKNLSPGEKYRIRIRTLCTECSTQNITNKKSFWAFIADFETLKNNETTKTIVSGLIYNDKLEPVIDATVVVNGVSTKTNQEGRYFVTAPVTERMLAKVDHPNYMTRAVGFVSTQAETLYKDVFLKKFTQTHTFDSQKSAMLGTNGFAMYLQDSAIINEKTGKPYYGKVLVDLSALQPGDALFGEQMPGGDFLAKGKDGKEYVMYSYGFFSCEMRGEGGEELNLAPEQKARVEFVVPAHQRNKMQENVPLWHFDETQTIWVEDGVTKKNGNNYSGEVSHFSAWNCDYKGPRSWVEGEVIYCNGTNTVGGTIYTEQVAVQVDCRGAYRSWIPSNWESDIFSDYRKKEYTTPKLAPDSVFKVPKITSNSLRSYGSIDESGLLTIYKMGGEGVMSYSADGGNSFQTGPNFQFNKDDTTHRECVVRDEKGCESKFTAKMIKNYSQVCSLVPYYELMYYPVADNFSKYLELLSTNKPYLKVRISSSEIENWLSNAQLTRCLQGIYIDGVNGSPETFMNAMQESPNLQEICMQRCRFVTTPNFAYWKNLSILNLQYDNLNTLSKEIGECKNLAILDLRNNNLRSLPREVGEWKKIDRLELDQNQLASLPPEVGKWQKLTYLSLNQNQLTSLPPEVGEWESLNKLLLYGNQLTSLPNEVEGWVNLHTLSLNQNQLTSLPPGVRGWKKLEYLYIPYSNLTNLPPEVGEWENLIYVDLRSCQLTSLPPEVKGWKSLKSMEITNNKLTLLPKEIGEWKNLTNLICSFNNLTFLPSEVGQWKKLEQLDLKSNLLTSLPPEIAQLKDNLKELDLRYNEFSTEEKAKIVGWLPNTIITW